MTACSRITALLLAGLALLGTACDRNGEGEGQPALNVYSARHYQSDDALYEEFTRATGIEVHRIEAGEDELMERIRQEGAASPADVLITVDAGRLWRADQAGLFQPVESQLLRERIPASLRHPDGHWFGYATRARLIFYDRQRIDPAGLADYEDLADPRWKGELCIRSGNHVYNLSLMASLIAHHGLERAEEWARGVVANFAREPQGGDTDQIKAVGSGECQIAVSNTYYIARLLRSTNADDKALMERVGVVFPNQSTWGTHVNIAGGAVAKNSKNTAAAVKFLEYLASAEAQNYFANGNNEWPTAKGVKVNNPALTALSGGGDFKTETIPLAAVGANQVKVQQMLDRVGFK